MDPINKVGVPQEEFPRERPQPKEESRERLTTPDFEIESEPSYEQREKSTEGAVNKEQVEGVSAAPQSGSVQVPSTKTQQEEMIEDIMEEGLGDIYAAMTQEKQEEFKAAGEKTASKINELLSETKVKVKKIVELIRGWLRLIPGVNKYFLDQEAKLKADKILDIAEEDGAQHAKDQNKI